MRDKRSIDIEVPARDRDPQIDLDLPPMVTEWGVMVIGPCAVHEMDGDETVSADDVAVNYFDGDVVFLCEQHTIGEYLERIGEERS